MANNNQGVRSGNVFGAPFGQGHGSSGEGIALKPGFLLKIRDRFVMVESVEALTVDLFFTDSHSVTVGSNQITDAALIRYGQNSITAAMFPNGSPATGSTTATVLSPNYDSGHIKAVDLHPSSQKCVLLERVVDAHSSDATGGLVRLHKIFSTLIISTQSLISATFLRNY